MPHAPKTSVNSAKLQTKRSAWTPLNHAPSNSQICFCAQFSNWTDSQKKTILQDLIQSCSLDQLMLLRLTLSRRLPLQAADFTCMLPRALSLYIFSFLDPRSLCRCAQVSWRWKNIVDLDQLWMVKCLRRGWFLDFSPTQFEVNVWKRHYISTVQRLRSAPTADSPHEELCLEDALLSEPHPESKNSSTRKQKQANRSSLSLPPWRDADPRPRDIVRFNYLDNPHSVTEAWTTSKTLTEAHYKLRKAKSLMFLSSNCRPTPSPPTPLDQSEHRIHSAQESVKKLLRESQFNAGVRPGPVRSSVPRLSLQGLRTAQRSHRSVPSEYHPPQTGGRVTECTTRKHMRLKGIQNGPNLMS
uniref:F-box domain-containing protein n=1 Tax=Periophthalmus magnuspinnatus TaxID=409849 RepID=A0A3B4AN74_9GOBI